MPPWVVETSPGPIPKETFVIGAGCYIQTQRPSLATERWRRNGDRLELFMQPWLLLVATNLGELVSPSGTAL
jgi:hypothetical protein